MPRERPFRVRKPKSPQTSRTAPRAASAIVAAGLPRGLLVHNTSLVTKRSGLLFFLGTIREGCCLLCSLSAFRNGSGPANSWPAESARCCHASAAILRCRRASPDQFAELAEVLWIE